MHRAHRLPPFGSLALLAPLLTLSCGGFISEIDSDQWTDSQEEGAKSRSVKIYQNSPAELHTRPAERVRITYNWSGGPTSKSLINFVHFVSPEGAIIFQDDHWPSVPTNQWSKAARSEVRELVVPDVPAGTYRIFAGLYDGGPGGSGAQLALKQGSGVTRDTTSPRRYLVGTLVIEPPAVPAAPSFTRAYGGRDSANLNRRWAWQPVAGAERYLVKPDWIPEFYTAETQWQWSDSELNLSHVLSQGPHTVSVQAVSGTRLGPAAVDTINVRYFRDPSITSFGKQDIGLGGVVAHNPPADVIGIRYRFRIHTNASAPAGAPPFNKIIFGANRFSGPAGGHYATVQMFEMSRRAFTGPVCDVKWPPSFTHPGESSLWIAVADYTGANRQGLKTQGPGFSVLHSYVDGNEQVTNRVAVYQGNLNGVDGSYTLLKKGAVTDREGWRCVAGRSLPPGDFTQWDATVEAGGTQHLINLALPAEYAQYLNPSELQGWRWEFPLSPGYLTFYAWEVQVLREGTASWEPLREWRVNELAAVSTLDFGIKKGAYNGQEVIELSNDAPSEYLEKDAVFAVLP